MEEKDLNISTNSNELTDPDERYNKLKVLAAKLKRKTIEQAAEIKKLDEEKAKLFERTKMTLKIQQELDNAQDEVDRLKKKEKSLEKDLKASIDLNIKSKEAHYDENSQIQSLTATNIILRDKVERLEKSEVENKHWKEMAETLEKELKEAKVVGAGAEQEKRQATILSLEISDYEKKIQNFQDLLEDKDREMERLKEDVIIKEKVIEEDQEKILTSQEKIEQLTGAKETLQADVIRKTEKVNFLQEELTKLNEKLNEKKQEYGKLELDHKFLKMNLETEMKQFDEKETSMMKTISNLEHRISLYEEEKLGRESQISNLKLEIRQLDSEYNNYKVKALTMLRSQKPLTNDAFEKDQLENMQKIVQDFHSEIGILKSDFQALKAENENLVFDKTELTLKLNKFKTNCLENELALNNDITSLKEELRKKDTKFSSEIDKLKAEHETDKALLIENFESKKVHYESQLRSFKEELELSRIPETFENPKPQLQPNDEIETPIGFRPINPNIPLMSNSVHMPLTIDTNLNTPGMYGFEQLRMMPRGECEGSESVNSTYLSRNDNISFEQLLSASFESVANSKVTDLNEFEIHNYDQLKTELQRSNSQIQHLTSIIRESESNCERLNQLSEALKEEIRRIERDNERKEHIKENTEYLKNILLKFITLNGEDERLRLIPVIQTMLKLSPEELARLENSVKGSGISKKEGAGWGSYLPIWSQSGGSK